MADSTQKPHDDKELLYKALGVMLLIKDKFSDEFDEIFDKANASKEEILQSVDEVKAEAETEKSEIEEKFKSKIREVIDEMGLATKEDIAELKAMLKRVEKERSK